MMNTGDKLPGRPSMGSWVTYGLGSENQNLPGFVVLCPAIPIVGPQLWSSSFLPAIYQGTYIPNNEKTPDKLIQSSRTTRLTHGGAAPAARSAEQAEPVSKCSATATTRSSKPASNPRKSPTACRPKRPRSSTSQKRRRSLRARYGDSDFGRGCLMARRLVEKGVRMVQVYFGNGQPWDNHDDILIHRKLANDADGPIAALLQDLKASGMLNETLVIIGGEFGRTPVVEVSGLVKVQNGRDHNSHGFSMVLAGGGVKAAWSTAQPTTSVSKPSTNPSIPTTFMQPRSTSSASTTPS